VHKKLEMPPAAIVAGAALLVLVARLLAWLHARFVAARGFDWRIVVEQDGQTSSGSQGNPRRALVTGSSAGLGLAIARALCRRGVRVVLVGRSAETLESAAELCRQDFRNWEGKGRNASQKSGSDSVEPALTVVCDLTRPKEALNAIKAALGDEFFEEKVGVLVNCLGGSGQRQIMMDFVDTTPELWTSVRRLNVDHVLFLMHAVLPGMIRRNAGAVLNISTQASVAVPWRVSHYASDKRKLNFLTGAVADEVRARGATGVRFGSALVGEVATPGNGYSDENDIGIDSDKRPSLLVATSPKLAEDTLRLFGRSLEYTPDFWHEVSGLAALVLPRFLMCWIGLRVMTVKSREWIERQDALDAKQN
jgi:NAD(P)-dependent dehydrogenase (short-subunit alcohol dehydrogenase family)